MCRLMFLRVVHVYDVEGVERRHESSESGYSHTEDVKWCEHDPYF